MKKRLVFAMLALLLLPPCVAFATSIAPQQPWRFGSAEEFLAWVREYREMKAAYGEGIFEPVPAPIDHFYLLKNPLASLYQIEYWLGESGATAIYRPLPTSTWLHSALTLSWVASAQALPANDKVAFAEREGDFAICKAYKVEGGALTQAGWRILWEQDGEILIADVPLRFNEEDLRAFCVAERFDVKKRLAWERFANLGWIVALWALCLVAGARGLRLFAVPDGLILRENRAKGAGSE